MMCKRFKMRFTHVLNEYRHESYVLYPSGASISHSAFKWLAVVCFFIHLILILCAQVDVHTSYCVYDCYLSGVLILFFFASQIAQAEPKTATGDGKKRVH